jgi:hypothetical protein
MLAVSCISVCRRQRSSHAFESLSHGVKARGQKLIFDMPMTYRLFSSREMR